MLPARWSPLAEYDLEDILYYIGVEAGRPETARRLGVALRDAFDEHLRLGTSGHKYPVLPAEWRYFKFKRWLIAYESTDDAVIVHRVIDAARDLPGIFRDAE